MKNNLYEITLLETSKNNNLHCLSSFLDNLLEIWYFNLDHHPKHFLVEYFLDVLFPDWPLYKKYNYNWYNRFKLYFNLYSRFKYKLNLYVANNYNYKDKWDYTHHIHMFNKEGNIIGNIIEISYDESIYNNYDYDYNTMINEIYEAIKNNAGNYNRDFYIYLSDDKYLYDRLDRYNFWVFRKKNFRLNDKYL